MLTDDDVAKADVIYNSIKEGRFDFFAFRMFCLDLYMRGGFDSYMQDGVQPTLDKRVQDAYNEGYEKGRSDALTGGGV